MESVRLHGHRPHRQQPAVLHVELGRLQRQQDFLTPFTVPTAAMRAGDFSAFAPPLLDSASCSVPRCPVVPSRLRATVFR